MTSPMFLLFMMIIMVTDTIIMITMIITITSIIDLSGGSPMSYHGVSFHLVLRQWLCVRWNQLAGGF